jgi:hypothetical protein
MIVGFAKALLIIALGIGIAVVSGLATTDQVKDQAVQIWKTIH